MMRKKLLIFHPALAPYRIDVFNKLNEEFETNIYFFRKTLITQKLDTDALHNQLNFKPEFLTTGFNISYRSRMIRFGFVKKIFLHKPDIILCSEFNLITFITVLISKVFLPKTNVFTFCDDSVDVAKNSTFDRKIGRVLCMKLLDGAVFGNDSAERWYNKEFPKVQSIVFPIIQKEERLLSILNDTQELSNEYLKKFKLEDKTVLLFVGRLVEVKNLKFLIEVFSRYLLINRNVVLTLIGDGNKKSELIGLVERLNIQDDVIFAGQLEYKALYAWYAIADYSILPSTSETFGAVVNESLIAGVPVICSNLAGAVCLINEKNGIPFNPFDKEELLSIFSQVLNKKKTIINQHALHDSLMPFTFNQRTHELMNYLKYENFK